MIQKKKLKGTQTSFGYTHINLLHTKARTEEFCQNLDDVMTINKLNRAMANMRHLNPDMYKVINNLWKSSIGKHNLFKLKFTLTYVISYLEEYLDLCE